MLPVGYSQVKFPAGSGTSHIPAGSEHRLSVPGLAGEECQTPAGLDDWRVWRGWMRMKMGSEEWEVAILTHQKPQILIEVKGSPIARDIPASKLFNNLYKWTSP